MSDVVDLLVIGGGINGAGIARDAAGRGLSVLLCEKDDLAQGTSSRSGKLVHGGLRYLEYYEFRLVREALIEREVLLRSASHIIWPVRFVLPHSPSDRPAWLVRLGLFLYDHLGGRKVLPGTRSLNLAKDPEGAPLKSNYRKGFEYSDCWVDDARLVVLNAVDAKQRGAEILTRTACTSARRDGSVWNVELTDTQSHKKRNVTARAIVNAGGPWVNEIVNGVIGTNSTRSVKLVKGSHIIVKKFWEGSHGYLVQNHDKRVIFVNPYEGDKALIGTTDIVYEGAPENVEADDEEVSYLIAVVNKYFEQQLSNSNVLQKYSGVRPLFDDGNGNPSAVTRDYVLDLDDEFGAPLLNIFGGKITTFRKLAEHAIEKLFPYFPAMNEAWTADGRLPGGDIPEGDVDKLVGAICEKYNWMPPKLAKHYARLYGTLAFELVGSVDSMEGLGQQFGPNLFEVEARYLCDHEWAQTSEDILFRRTKHNLHMTDEEQSIFDDWINSGFEHSGKRING